MHKQNCFGRNQPKKTNIGKNGNSRLIARTTYKELDRDAIKRLDNYVQLYVNEKSKVLQNGIQLDFIQNRCNMQKHVLYTSDLRQIQC